jgi:hypothetical protein
MKDQDNDNKGREGSGKCRGKVEKPRKFQKENIHVFEAM